MSISKIKIFFEFQKDEKLPAISILKIVQIIKMALII